MFYLAWLVLFLGWGYVIGLPFYAWIHRRPGRVSTWEGGSQTRAFKRQVALHLKFRMVQSLPMVQALQGLPFWRQLVCRGYAPQNKIGRNTHVFCTLIDPDLTEIGDGTIIGMDTHIICHALTAQPDGNLTYVSAPVVIGRRVTVGGNCRIALDARIGDDSILEAGSNLLPYTAIPAGEVWGGHPARFLRKRFEEAATPTESLSGQGSACAISSVASRNLTLPVRQLVASSLNLDIEQVSAESSTRDDRRVGFAGAVWDRRCGPFSIRNCSRSGRHALPAFGGRHRAVR